VAETQRGRVGGTLEGESGRLGEGEIYVDGQAAILPLSPSPRLPLFLLLGQQKPRHAGGHEAGEHAAEHGAHAETR
jgi:hypothetical protein